MRFSAELLQIRDSLEAGTLSAIEKVRASARGLELRAILGAARPAPETDPLIAEREAARADLDQYEKLLNTGHVSPAAGAAIDRLSAAIKAISDRDEAAAWEAGKARDIATANNKPHMVKAADVLTPAGSLKADAINSRADTSVWFYQGNVQHLSFTATVTINGEADRGAEAARATLEGIKAAKANGYVLRNYRAGKLGTVWVLENANNMFLTRAGFEGGANPVFARPDMPPAEAGYDSMIAQQKVLATAFVSWLDTLPYDQRHNQGVVSRKISSTPVGSWARVEKQELGLTLSYRLPGGGNGIRIVGKDFDALVEAARKLAVMPEIEQPAAPSEQEAKGDDSDAADQYAAKAVGFDTFSLYAASRIDKLPLREFQVARAKYKIVECLEKTGRSDRNTLGSLQLQGANAEGPSALAQLRQDGVVLNNLRAQSKPFSLAPGVTLASFVEKGGIVIPLEQAAQQDQTAEEPDVPKPPIELTGTEFGEFPDTPEGKKALRGAAEAYLKAMRGQMVNCPVLGAQVEIRQRGIKETLAFSGNPKKIKLLHAVPQILASATAAEFVQNFKLDKKPQVVGYYNLSSVVALAGESIAVRVVVEKDNMGHLYYDLMIDPPKEKAMLDSTSTALGGRCSPDNYSGHPSGASVEHENADVMLDDMGGLVLNMFIEGELSEPEPAEAPEPPPASDVAHQIIEYTTKRDKVLRGIIRTDLTQAQAKEIDPYTWRMNGGYFIREKYLSGETAHIPAAQAPVVLSPEQQAEQLATAERQAAERAQKALSNQVEKLRAVANKAVETGHAGMNQERNTNTARRAGMAASSVARASYDKAAGQTLNNIADAIENGTAGLLAKLSSRAQLEELQKALHLAQYEADKHLSYSEQLSRKGRPVDDNDLKHVTMPSLITWSERFRKASEAIAKQNPKGNSRLIAALAKMGQRSERFTMNSEDMAITRKANDALKGTGTGSWILEAPMEAIAKTDRLARMGITDVATMQAAVRELIPMMVAKVEEDPIKKAERAIIGQKVGLDFFPTPAHLAQRMATLAGIKKGMRVLEPSAGNGNLADAAKAAGGEVDVIELSDQLREILTAKGYNVVGNDFDTFTPEQPYPAIIMNPPFSNRRDAAHIMRAFGMLAPGGTLVAIAGEGVFFGRDAAATSFRAWLESHDATVEPLEGGTFKDKNLLAQTDAGGRLIVLEK
jgi:hypothetical protein